MAQSTEISRARVLVRAAQSVCNAELGDLRPATAKHSASLPTHLVLRLLLTYLPAATHPHYYIDFLQDLDADPVDDGLDSNAFSFEREANESDEVVLQQARKLVLRPLNAPQAFFERIEGSLFRFVYFQCHRIAIETGSLLSASQLLEPFASKNWYLNNWAFSIFTPVFRLQYVHENRTRHSICTLKDIEQCPAENAIPVLLSNIEKVARGVDSDTIGNLLNGVIKPYIRGRIERLSQSKDCNAIGSSTREVESRAQSGAESSQAQVNEWLLGMYIRDPAVATEVVDKWNGVDDCTNINLPNGGMQPQLHLSQMMKSLYAQAILSMLYTSSQDNMEGINAQHLVYRAAELVSVDASKNENSYIKIHSPESLSAYLQMIKQSDLLHHALLRHGNTFTTPCLESLNFVGLCGETYRVLKEYGLTSSIKSIAQITLFAGKADQHRELMRFLSRVQSQRRTDAFWTKVRSRIMWLRKWASEGLHEDLNSMKAGLFGLLEVSEIDAEVFRAMLLNGNHQHALDIYCKTRSKTLAPDQIEQLTYDVVIFNFDSASNGNKTRGEIRKASEILSTFEGSFPNSRKLQEAKALIAASHSMSFYSLILEHGIPFRPVNIRAQSDPLLLIEKILRQNPHSYTKLDDLIDIGKKLTQALPLSKYDNDEALGNEDEKAAMAQMRAQKCVSAMAIQAALDEEDLDTAYTYVINRPDLFHELPTPPDHNSPQFQGEDDVLWKIAYKAGCHTSESTQDADLLRRFEQRLELLSRALSLAPPSALTEILAAWRQCEIDMNALLAHEQEQEEEWDNRADHGVPGGFGSPQEEEHERPRKMKRGVLGDEAPMGLFDVAKGAAFALRKSAFPLSKGHSFQNGRPTSDSEDAAETGNKGFGDDHRVRKRDVVGNMVTGGLASGLGWVLGAQPVNREQS